jgi:hypothetical protein
MRSTIFSNVSWEVIFVIYALVVSGWIGYTSANSIYANIAEDELLELSPGARLIIGVAGVATGSASLWVFAEGFLSDSAPARIDSLAAAASIVSGANLAILSASTWAFAKSWPRLDGKFPYMALHHPSTHVANDHLLQAAFLFITVTTTYLLWRLSYWLSAPKTIGQVIAVILSVVPFGVAFAFVKGVTSGTEKHIAAEKMRFRADKANATLIRAGGNEEVAKSLNDKRLMKIKVRFDRIQDASKWVAFAPALVGYLSKVIFGR